MPPPPPPMPSNEVQPLVNHSEEQIGKLGKVLKVGAMALPVVGGVFTGVQAAEKINDINNSNLSPEAKNAAHGFNAAMTADAFVDPTLVAGMAGQQATKAAIIKKYGEQIAPLLVQTDGEALADAMGEKRFENAQAIIDTLPKDPKLLKEMATDKNLSADMRHLAEGQMMIKENYYNFTPSGIENALAGKDILDKTAAKMCENQKDAGTQTSTNLEKAQQQAKEAGCTGKDYQCTEVYVSPNSRMQVLANNEQGFAKPPFAQKTRDR